MSDFRIKICGITQVADALAAVEAGADAIGLNFSATSKRHVSRSNAQTIVRAVRSRSTTVKFVGVFVEQSPGEVEALVDQVDLDLIQLHGDQDVSVLARTWSRPILWVARVPMGGGPELAERLGTIAQSVVARSGWTLGTESPPDRKKLAGILVDAFAPGNYGGTGQTVAWEPLGQRDSWSALGWSPTAWPTGLPLVLAGGLNPQNVATAVHQTRPSAVDVASGVESAPGIKSREQMFAFVAAARESFGDRA
jgi:phosphoribosylanthranilate isomerase